MSGNWRREHEWDRLRALLMLLGIPYHAGMAYNLNVLWDIHSPDKSSALTFLTGILVTFRMPAFFIVAGYFAVMMLGRAPGGSWLRNRFVRLGIPFATGFVFLVPPQLFLMHLSEALSLEISMESAMAEAEADLLHPGVDWIMHLWFLPALVAYSTLLALGWRISARPAIMNALARFDAWLERRRDALFLILVALLMVWELVLRAAFIELDRLGPGLPALAARGLDPYLRYLPYFALGALLRRSPAVRHAFRLPQGWVLPAATVLSAAIAAFTRARGVEILDLVNSFATGAAAVMASRLLIGYAHAHWNRPDERVGRLVDASFTIYLLHHPIIYVLAVAFIPLSWPPVIEFLVIGLGAGLLSYGAHRMMRRSPLALFLLNGVMPRVKEKRLEGVGGTFR